MNRALLLVRAALIAAPALSACGLKDRPERPVPLWGNPPNEGPNDPRTLKARQDAEDAEKARKKAEQDQERAQRAAEQAQQPAATPAAPATPPAPQ
jgi:hypothetical protein